MTSYTQDLAWDHSVGEQLMNEDSSLLEDASGDDSQYCSGIAPFHDHQSSSTKENCVTLTTRQLGFLIRTLGDAQSVLKAKSVSQRSATSPHAVSIRLPIYA